MSHSSETRPTLDLWVVYDSPKDHPGKVVVRLWRIAPTFLQAIATTTLLTFDDIEAARARLRERGHVYRINRSPDDDPVIVETWL